MASRVPPIDDDTATVPSLVIESSTTTSTPLDDDEDDYGALKHEESPAPSPLGSEETETPPIPGPADDGGEGGGGGGGPAPTRTTTNTTTATATTTTTTTSPPPPTITTTTAAAVAAGRKRKLNSMSARGVANLNPEQLAKKRANDRQAQRAIRERTKSHIDALEQQVRDLSSQKPFLDLQAALRQNEAIQAENREIRQGLKAITDIIQPLLGQQGLSLAPPPINLQGKPVQPPVSPSLYPDNTQFNHTPNMQRSSTAERSYTESIASLDTPSPTQSSQSIGGSRRDSAYGVPGAASFRVAFDSQRHNLGHGLDFSPDERLGFNFLLDASQQVPKAEGVRRTPENHRTSQPGPTSTYTPPINPLPTEQNLPAYMTPIRNISPTCPLDAILLDFLHTRQREAAQGVPKQKLVGPPYPSVSSLLNPEKSVYSHPVSKVFTDILRAFPDISTLPEQVAVLYLMFILMRWQIYPTTENYERVPEWFTPRPSQLLTPHPAWIDYIPWPRMRDRLVMTYQDYPFENWFVPFTRTLSVNWPYEATDCLLATSDSEELIINPVFERHFTDISNWSLGPAFAEAFPQLVETTRVKKDPTWPTPGS